LLECKNLKKVHQNYFQNCIYLHFQRLQQNYSFHVLKIEKMMFFISMKIAFKLAKEKKISAHSLQN